MEKIVEVMLRLLAIYFAAKLLNALPLLSGTIIPILTGHDDSYHSLLSSALITGANTTLMLALILGLWVKAPKLAANLTKGAKTEKLNEAQILMVQHGLMICTGFLILAQSFRPLTYILNDVFRLIEQGEWKGQNEISIQFALLFLLGLSLITKPAQIWRAIMKVRTL